MIKPMKIIHCGDIHLGSRMEARLPKEKADERKREVLASFGRMIEYARKEGVEVILLAGDVFDSDRPLKKDKEFFYQAVKDNPDIDFLYLRGNHDSMEAYTEYGLENLKTFDSGWRAYTYGEVVISGTEIAAENAASFYNTLRLDAAKKNIVMLHGQTEQTMGKDKIKLSALRDKNIDYLALGHVHSYVEKELDGRGRYAYCGCLEGRGFDECGEKGFVLLEVGDRLQTRFIPHAYRTIWEAEVDVSGAQGLYQICRKAREQIVCEKKDMVRVVLTGELSFDGEGLDRELEKQLSADFYFVSVKDKTTRSFDVDRLAGDVSLRGEFIRTVLGDERYTKEQKQRIIGAGLRALQGREVEV